MTCAMEEQCAFQSHDADLAYEAAQKWNCSRAGACIEWV